MFAFKHDLQVPIDTMYAADPPPVGAGDHERRR